MQARNLVNVSGSSRAVGSESVGLLSLPGGDAMRSIQAVILLDFLGASVFALQNTDVDSANFLSWNGSEPIALLTVVFYLLGLLSGWTVVSFVTWSRTTDHRATTLVTLAYPA